MKSLLALLVAALLMSTGAAGYAQHSRRVSPRKSMKKRRAPRVRARDEGPPPLPIDDDDEMVELAQAQPRLAA